MRVGLVTCVTLAVLHGLCIQIVQAGRKRPRGTPVVCRAGSHTFYHPQAGICLPCDSCTVGYSLVPSQEFALDMDPEHGATNCFPCRMCKPGTYMDKRTFNTTCKRCRNCTAVGREEKSPCTPKADAVCGEVIEYSNIKELQASAKEVKLSAFQDHSSYNMVVYVLLILLTFFTLITTAFVFLRRVHRRAFKLQCNENASKKSDEEESLQCLNNHHPKVCEPCLSIESPVVNIPTVNEETRPKEKAQNTGQSAPKNTRNGETMTRAETRVQIPPLNLISDSTTLKTPKSSNKSGSWDLGASDFTSTTSGRQYSIGYTNLALSRSVTSPSTDACSVPDTEQESLGMLSQFSYVLDE